MNENIDLVKGARGGLTFSYDEKAFSLKKVEINVEIGRFEISTAYGVIYSRAQSGVLVTEAPTIGIKSPEYVIQSMLNAGSLYVGRESEDFIIPTHYVSAVKHVSSIEGWIEVNFPWEIVPRVGFYSFSCDFQQFTEADWESRVRITLEPLPPPPPPWTRRLLRRLKLTK